MQRRSFFGAIAAAIGIGASNKADAAPKLKVEDIDRMMKAMEGGYYYQWKGGLYTDDPAFNGAPPQGKEVRVFCDGVELGMVTRMQTGPNGWAETLVSDATGWLVVDWPNNDVAIKKHYGDVWLVIE